jgi:hypothetical protein
MMAAARRGVVVRVVMVDSEIRQLEHLSAAAMVFSIMIGGGPGSVTQ